MKRNKQTKSKVDTSVYHICSTALNNEPVSVILFLKESEKNKFKEKLSKTGCNVKYEYDFINAIAADIYANLINEFANDDCVSYIASDIKTTTCLDIARASIGANDLGYEGNGIGVALIDTGIYPHPDLSAKRPRIIEFVDYVNGKTKPYDDNGHGTHCAGIIAGDGTGSSGKIKGIAPKANLIGLKVMDSFGEGNASDILAALQWCLKNKERYNIRVVSLSLGAAAAERKTYDPMVIAVEKLWDSGIIVVAAAGNEGPAQRTIDSPGISRKIITVGASDDCGTIDISDDRVADFSSRGPSPYSRNKPDILAPGVGITSLSNSGTGYTEMSGTSMATPIIAGCCAVICEKYPGITPDQVKQKIFRGAYSLKNPAYVQGKGIINAKAMLS